MTAPFSTTQSYPMLMSLLEFVSSFTGYDCVVLKGAVMYAAYYAPGFDRPFTDIDLLVPKFSLSAAHEALLIRGYSEALGRPRSWYSAHHMHWRYVKEGRVP